VARILAVLQAFVGLTIKAIALGLILHRGLGAAFARPDPLFWGFQAGNRVGK